METSEMPPSVSVPEIDVLAPALERRVTTAAAGAREAGRQDADDAHRPATLAERFAAVRAQTESLCEPLETEDYVVSSMPDVSPTKWHLAHTSWFFETFVLAPFARSYVSPNPRYAFLFNSY